MDIPKKKKAVSIVVEYEDGSKDVANGQQATDIWSWLMGAETMNCIHGAVYNGEKFTEIPAGG